MNRRLAHSYLDELPARREPAVPAESWENTWWGILAQVLIVAALMLGIPFLIWLAGS